MKSNLFSYLQNLFPNAVRKNLKPIDPIADQNEASLPSTRSQAGEPDESLKTKKNIGSDPDENKELDLVAQLGSLRSVKKKSDAYIDLAERLYFELQPRLTPFWSRHHEILTGGASNLFTAKVSVGEVDYFLKATVKTSDPECFFYNLLMDGSVKEEGYNFSFIKPVSIVESEKVRVYVFPFVDVTIVKYTPDNITHILNGLAEVAARNMVDRAAKKSKLKFHKFDLSPGALDEVRGNSIFDSEDEKAAALGRHEAILSDWGSVLGALKELDHALCNRDARRENLALAQDRVILFDMGAVALAPPGTDLYYISREVAHMVDGTQICKDYAAALADFGVSIPYEDVQLAANAASAYKWLNVSKRDGSTLKAQNYLYALERAEACVRACRA